MHSSLIEKNLIRFFLSPLKVDPVPQNLMHLRGLLSVGVFEAEIVVSLVYIVSPRPPRICQQCLRTFRRTIHRV